MDAHFTVDIYPQNPESNLVDAPAGIPINGSLLPAIPGFDLTAGLDLDYNEDIDFYCAGSSTSKPVCQLYGNAKVKPQI